MRALSIEKYGNFFTQARPKILLVSIPISTSLLWHLIPITQSVCKHIWSNSLVQSPSETKCHPDSQEIHSCLWTQKFSIMFTHICHWSLPGARRTQFTPSNHISLICFSHLCLGLKLSSLIQACLDYSKKAMYRYQKNVVFNPKSKYWRRATDIFIIFKRIQINFSDQSKDNYHNLISEILRVMLICFDRNFVPPFI